MSHGTSAGVECPLCGESFDPAAAAGWCTNADCGDWRHEGNLTAATGSPTDDGAAAGARPRESVPVEASADAAADAALACPNCGGSVAATDNFCRACGREVRHVEPGALTACPACEGPVEPGDGYCRACGEALDPHRDGATATGRVARPPSAGGATDEDLGGTERGRDDRALSLAVRGREIRVTDGDTVGREVRRIVTETGGDEADAVRVHREHVQFEREADGFYLIDLGRNPTVLDGDRLRRGDRVRVAPGDRIELSETVALRVRDA